MSSRVYLHLKDVAKPSIVQNGDFVDINKETGELIVKDVTGEVLGCFRYDSVIGWSIEREPVDASNLSEKDLTRLAAEIRKHGIKQPDENPR